MGGWLQGTAWPGFSIASRHVSSDQNAVSSPICWHCRQSAPLFPASYLFLHRDSMLPVQVLCGAAHTAILTSFGKVYVCGAAYAGQLGLGIPLTDAPSPTLVSLPAFACDVGCGWECTIVVTHARECSGETSACSLSSGSRLRAASDCSDADMAFRDAPSPSTSDFSASIATEGLCAENCSLAFPNISWMG
jgi:hypothetical protein